MYLSADAKVFDCKKNGWMKWIYWVQMEALLGVHMAA